MIIFNYLTRYMDVDVHNVSLTLNLTNTLLKIQIVQGLECKLTVTLETSTGQNLQIHKLNFGGVLF